MTGNRTFETRWSEEDEEFVGTCDEYPSLSHLALTEPDALAGIMKLVADIDSSSSPEITPSCGCVWRDLNLPCQKMELHDQVCDVCQEQN